MLKRILLFIVASIALAPGLPAHAATNEPYVAGSAGDAATYCRGDADNPTGLNIGGACFNISSGTIKVTVVDDVVDTPGFWVEMEKADNTCVGDNPDDPLADCPGFIGPFCRTQTVGVLSGTHHLRIFLDGPVFGPLDCETGATTTGKVVFG